MTVSVLTKTRAESLASGTTAASTAIQPQVATQQSLMTAWWVAPWQVQAVCAESYWQAWHTMAWMPWNMVLSAWQLADSQMSSTEHPRGLWHSALGQPKLGCRPST